MLPSIRAETLRDRAPSARIWGQRHTISRNGHLLTSKKKAHAERPRLSGLRHPSDHTWSQAQDTYPLPQCQPARSDRCRMVQRRGATRTRRLPRRARSSRCLRKSARRSTRAARRGRGTHTGPRRPRHARERCLWAGIENYSIPGWNNYFAGERNNHLNNYLNNYFESPETRNNYSNSNIFLGKQRVSRPIRSWNNYAGFPGIRNDHLNNLLK